MGTLALKPPLFILAPPRSFTSVVCAMLGCHPQAFGLAESNLFVGDTIADLRELYKTRRRMSWGLLRSLSELAWAEQNEETVATARRWLLDKGPMSTAELFRSLQGWAGDRILIDKSPSHTREPEALQRMKTHFPEARYLHLTRHPGDTVTSTLQLLQRVRDELGRRGLGPAERPPDPLDSEAPNKFWLEPHSHILEFLRTVPVERQMRVRGEDLLSEPRNYVRRIAEWLDIRTDRAAVDAMLHPENSPFAKYGPKNAPYGNDPNFMENPELRPFSFAPRPFTWTTPDGAVHDLAEPIRDCAVRLGY